MAATPSGVIHLFRWQPVVSLRSTHRLQRFDAFGIPKARREMRAAPIESGIGFVGALPLQLLAPYSIAPLPWATSLTGLWPSPKIAYLRALRARSLFRSVCDVGAKFREELGKVGVKGVIVLFEFGDRFSESDGPAKAAADSLERAPNAVDFTIGAQQIGSLDLLETNGCGRRKILAQRFKRRVNRLSEILERRLGIAKPIAREKVVVKHVGEDSAESAIGGAEKEDAAANDAMGIRKGVDLTMPPDSALKLAAKTFQFLR